MADPSSDEPFSLTNELARERNREAADRTLLAWIRTSLAMISLGFGIERLGQAAVGLDGDMTGFSPLKTRIAGCLLISLGMAATLAGIWEHRYMLRSILDTNYRYADRPAIARYMGYALLAVAAAALIVILFGL
jgi:putative membrane protein